MEGKKVVLGVDDSPQQLQNYKLFLGEKYDLRLVDSAPAAISFLTKNDVDIILLDIEMPNINGFEFFSDIRRLPSKMTTPVIIVSSNSGGAFLTKAHEAGAADVLTKPVKQDTLISAIEKALGNNT